MRKKFSLLIFPALLSLLALLVAACGSPQASTPSGSAATKAPADKQVFIDPYPESGVSDIDTFDPALASDGPAITAIRKVFTGLVNLNNKLEVIDQLAASHSVSADGLTYTFTLRPNLKFSDGTALTSADVAYSINRALEPSLKSTVSPIYLALIKDSDKMLSGKVKTLIGDSLLTPDPQTIKIVTSQRAAYFLDELTYPTDFVIEKSMIEKYGDARFADHLSEGIGGAGPFVVSAYHRGKDIEFVPNKNYYGPHPALRKYVLPFYQSEDTEYKAFKTNQADRVSVPSAQVADAKALPNHQFHSFPALSINYVSFNYLVKPFDNIHIRQAFALALNKDAIAHDIDKDTVVATNHIVPQGMPGYYPDLTGPAGVKDTRGDAAKAKQLLQQGLQEEGMTSLPPITFTVSTGGSATQRNELAAMQQMWKTTLGTTVTLADIDFNTLLSQTNNAMNNPKGVMMWRLNWGADYPDPQDWLTLQFDKGVPNNVWNYGQNKSADATQQQATQKLMEQADANMDQTSRMQQYHQAEQQAVNDVAWIPIVQGLETYALKPCVVGINDASQGVVAPNDWANIYISNDPTCATTTGY